jgi:hypothetical protein
MLGTPKGLSDEKAARMMAALREGRTLRTFGVRAPRLEAYFKTHPDYAREALLLTEKNGEAALLRKGARLRNLTHCKHGHPLSGANISYEPNGRRKCLTCVKRREAAPRPPTQTQVDQVTAALNAGKTLSLICQGRIGAEYGQPRIVSFRKLRLYRRLNPAFDRFVISATANNNSKAQLRRWRPLEERTRIIRDQNNDYRKILAMLPANFPDKDDVISDIFEALSNGSLQRTDVGARVKHYVTAHYRMFPTNFAKFGDARLVSLDEVLFEGGTMTRGDNVSQSLWD